MSSRFVIYLLCAVVVYASGLISDGSVGKTIRVRVISAKTGKPFVETHLRLSIECKPTKAAAACKSIFDDWQYTDNNGIAEFHVLPPIPSDVPVFVTGIAGDWCAPAEYKSNEVLRGVSKPGFTSCPHRPLKKYLVKPDPGEIVIYLGEYSRWERALYFPWAS